MDSIITNTDDGGLTIRRVPISSLHLDPANARAHGEANMEAIVASLRRFGQAEPLVVQAQTGRVIGGNGRLVAMKQLGWTECDIVECKIDDLTATSLGIPVVEGRLALGTWQGIFLWEHRCSRSTRSVLVHVS